MRKSQFRESDVARVMRLGESPDINRIMAEAKSLRDASEEVNRLQELLKAARFEEQSARINLEMSIVLAESKLEELWNQ